MDRFQRILHKSKFIYVVGGGYGIAIASGIWEWRLNSYFKEWKEKHEKFWKRMNEFSPQLVVPEEIEQTVDNEKFNTIEEKLQYTRLLFLKYGYFHTFQLRRLAEIKRTKIEDGSMILDNEVRKDNKSSVINRMFNGKSTARQLIPDESVLESKPYPFTLTIKQHELYSQVLQELRLKHTENQEHNNEPSIEEKELKKLYSSQVHAKENLFAMAFNPPPWKIDEKTKSFRYSTIGVLKASIFSTLLFSSSKAAKISMLIIAISCLPIEMITKHL